MLSSGGSEEMKTRSTEECAGRGRGGNETITDGRVTMCVYACRGVISTGVQTRILQ